MSYFDDNKSDLSYGNEVFPGLRDLFILIIYGVPFLLGKVIKKIINENLSEIECDLFVITFGKMKNQSNDKNVEAKNASKIFLSLFLVAT